MAKRTYIAVEECHYCKSPIPLTEYDPALFYRLADSSFIRHTANPKCGALGKYEFSDLNKLDLPPIPNLISDMSFAEKILPR